MAEEKNKLDFTKLAIKKRLPEPSSTQPSQKKMYKEVMQTSAEDLSPQNKVGRKTWKTEGVQYVRMAFDTPVEMKKRLKLLLFDDFSDTYISQDEMINAALEDFLKKHGR